jgi:hypothetical protein
MKPELDKALCEKYPKIFANRHADMRATAMCWGFECGDGWYQIIEALCCAMQSHCDSNAISQLVASQVKEKYGTLRFYYIGGDDMTDGMVYLAEVMSGMTCEVCGQPGITRDTGWLTTRCDAHHES